MRIRLAQVEDAPAMARVIVDTFLATNRGVRKGIGRALVQATAAHLARFGIKKLHICTPVANTEGRIFYDRLGGRIIGTRDDYNDGELIPLVVYEWEDIKTL